jgi:dsRNA-specific ribonuclease
MDYVSIESKIEVSITKLEALLSRNIKTRLKPLFVRVILADNTVNQSNCSKLNEAYHLNEIESLETYGDAVLGLFVCDKFLAFSKQEVTDKKIELGNNQRLNPIGKHLLGSILIDVNPSPLDEITYAKALERLIGAIHKAYGARFTRKFLDLHNII